jgi:outer membrane protein OmpA-like peptidoglycan-associated protein
MKRLLSLVVAAGLMALAGAAQAQDWGGPYVGLRGGYGWGDSTGNEHVSGFPIPYRAHPSGLIGGGDLGWLWQRGPWVFGAEGDVDGADIVGRDITTSAHFKTRTSNDFDASLRAKGGFAWDRVLFYGTGGVAFGAVKTQYSCPTCDYAPGPFDTVNNIRTGWTVGGGVDVAIDPHWSAGIEYRYTDLGHKRLDDPVTTASDHNMFTFTAVTANINYRFLAPRRPTPEPPPFIPAAAPVPLPPPGAERAPRAFLVFFDFDRAELTPDGMQVVRAAAASFAANGFARIEVSGYTDLAGGQAYNMRLSERRADVVARALAAAGVPKGAMNVMWHGKEHPRVPTPDGARNPENRRVEIVMP